MILKITIGGITIIDIGRDEDEADLLDWAETLLCNSLPEPPMKQDEWDAIITKWRDAKHGATTAIARP